MEREKKRSSGKLAQFEFLRLLYTTIAWSMVSISIFLCLGLVVYYGTDSAIIHFNKTIEYYINTTRESVDLTIFNRLPFENCSQSFLTLTDLIFLSSSPETITTLKLVRLCVDIDIKSIEKLTSARRLIFENCTIHFLASPQREDYDFYPKNLSRWSFNQGRTDTFEQFIAMINHLGPLKCDLQLSNCFQPILSFNHFIPLDTQLIFLNITCPHFQLDEPSDIKTRTAIFLTPTIMINTQSSPCPSRDKYRWLNLKNTPTKFFSLRTLTCENRLIQLHFDLDPTTTETTKIDLTSEISLIQSTSSTQWTTPILINFSVVSLSILMLSIALLACLVRFVIKNKSTI